MTADDFYSLFPKKDQPPRDLGNVTPIDPERATRYARKALSSECENVVAAAEGTRNHTLNKAAYNISQLVAAGHVTHGDAWDALTHAARTAGLPDTEIHGTLTSGFKAGSEQPRVVAERPPLPDLTALEQTTDSEGGPRLNPCIDWHELWATEDDGEEWIVEPILPARRMVALYSAPKAGKSLLVLEMAVAISRGTEILGTTPDRPRRVLYVDFENDPRGDIRTRLQNMDLNPDNLDNLKYLSFPQLAKFDTAHGALDLMRHVDHYQCEVVIIDTVSRAVSGEENDNDTWLSFYRNTGLLLKQAGIACLRLDHSGKDKEKGMRGGSAKAGDVDAVWQLSAVGNETILLECTHHRMIVPDKRLLVGRQDWPLKHVVRDDTRATLADSQAVELDQILDVLNIPNSTPVRGVKAALKESGHVGRVAGFGSNVIAAVVASRQLRLDTSTQTPTTGVPGTPQERS